MSRRKHQRWRCNSCHRSFAWHNKAAKHARQFVWFKRWLVEGYTLRQLAYHSGYSVSTIRRILEFWLQQPPPEVSHSIAQCISAIIDGTFIKRRKGIVAVMNAIDHTILSGSYNVSEKPRDLGALFQFLAQEGLSPQYATIDGNPALSQALLRQWPEIILQRCLVHIQRQGLSWCRRNPKRTDAKHLRRIFLDVTAIHSSGDREKFLKRVYAWETTYGAYIAATAEHGYVFSDLKRARSMLLSALPNMFHYLNNPLVASSTNALEGYFSRLKQRYRQHRGLSVRHRHRYFQWYLSLCQL